MRAPWAGFVVCGVTLIATAATALADDDDGPRVLSVDARQPLAPAVIVAVPAVAPAQMLPAAAFSVLDDNGTRPTRVEHLGVARLDVALVLDTAADVSPAAVEEQQATALELLLHLQDAGQLGVYTTTSLAPQPLPSDRQANYTSLAALQPAGDRHVAAGLLGALWHFQPDPASRRAIIVMSAGSTDGTTPAETTLLADELTAGDVQVFWLASEGPPPPIVRDLIDSGQPVTLIEGKPAAVAADQVAAALRSQYRVTVDLTGALGPTRLRVESNGAVYEAPVVLAGAVPVPPSTVPPATSPAAAQPPAAAPLPTPVETKPAAAASIASVQPAGANAPRTQNLGIIEIGDGTNATWWALAFFVAVAAATTLVVVVASTLSAAGRGAHAGAPPGTPNRATAGLRLAVQRADPTEGGQ